ncbi:3-hydroxyacyl-ACP dehydratase FabZ family protein [Cytobacillus pseudoceanisediminis]|uniref:3-hydroxyacyl-ACP dehydratase FabZ family protein n=1 Tax=Cytobacillus pseudoceanisediminis TaxID=3051614 RepID=UPI003C2AC768
MLNQLMQLLPHEYPIRLVDEVIQYQKGNTLTARFSPTLYKKNFGNQEFIPETCLIEGLAQTAVIFTQLETKPLREDEHPLLGKIKSRIHRKATWDEKITYTISPVRIIEKKAILSGSVIGKDQNIILTAELSVSVSF